MSGMNVGGLGVRTDLGISNSTQRIGFKTGTDTMRLGGLVGRGGVPQNQDVHKPPSLMRRFFSGVGDFFKKGGELAAQAFHDGALAVGHAISVGAKAIGHGIAVGATALGKGALAVGRSVVHMTGLATAGLIYGGGKLAFRALRGAWNLTAGALKFAGGAISTLGHLMTSPIRTSKELCEKVRTGVKNLCASVKQSYTTWKQTRAVRDVATQALPNYRLGNVGHWLKSIFGATKHIDPGTTTGTFDKLPQERQQDVQDFAILSTIAYKGIEKAREQNISLPNGYAVMSKNKLPEKLQPFYDEKTGLLQMPSGLKALVVEKNGNPVLSFAGTQPTGDRKGSIDADFNQYFGLYSSMYQDALGVTQLMKGLTNDQGAPVTLQVCGHSLGGGLAQFCATATGVKAIGFNSAGLSSGTLSTLGQEKVNQSHDNILHIRLKGDPVSSSGTSKVGAYFKGVELGHVVSLEGVGGLVAPHLMKNVLSALENV